VPVNQKSPSQRRSILYLKGAAQYKNEYYDSKIFEHGEEEETKGLRAEPANSELGKRPKSVFTKKQQQALKQAEFNYDFIDWQFFEVQL